MCVCSSSCYASTNETEPVKTYEDMTLEELEENEDEFSEEDERALEMYRSVPGRALGGLNVTGHRFQSCVRLCRVALRKPGLQGFSSGRWACKRVDGVVCSRLPPVVQAAAAGRVESSPAEEQVWRSSGDLGEGLCPGSDESRRGPVGGPPPVQARVSRLTVRDRRAWVAACACGLICACAVRL